MTSTSLVPCFIQIPATDVARATKFYKNVLNFTFNPHKEENGDNMVFFHFKDKYKENDLSGGIFKFPDDLMAKHQPMLEVLYFATDDMEDVSDRIEKNGGTVRYTRRKVNHGWITGFVDTEGNCHGLYTETEAK